MFINLSALTDRSIPQLRRRCGIADRMPPPILPGDSQFMNKWDEALVSECYSLEPDNKPDQHEFSRDNRIVPRRPNRLRMNPQPDI
jgi:hypothetical protein